MMDPSCSDSQQGRVDKHFDIHANYWKDTYSQKDIFSVIYQRRQALALSYIDGLFLPKNSRILEIGSGAGFMTVALAKRGFLVQAIDHSQAMVDLTSKAAKLWGVDNQVKATIGDAHQLSYGSDSFDLVIALGVLPWLYDYQKALKEVKRVIHTGGYAVLTVDNVSRATTLFDPMTFPAVAQLRRRIRRNLQRARLLSSVEPWVNSPSYRQHSPKEFLSSLRTAGLVVLKSSSVGFGPFTLFGHRLFPEWVGVRLDVRLQSYAIRNYPVLRNAGSQFVVLVMKK
jgi:ubiquinone/menaquinone biosynthesis C-methylase UbiE